MTCAALCLAALATVLGHAPAQDEGAHGSSATHGAFAWPWRISFAHIQAAMEKRSYEVVQIRRVLDRSDPREAPNKWIAVRERLRHHAGGPGGESTFQLRFRGLDGRELHGEEWDRRAKRYDEISGFLFHNQSFGVSDVDAAAANYEIHFLGFANRAHRPAYQVAIVPKNGDRPSWRLDLDLATGYPLYRAEYDSQETRVAEVVVERYDPRFKTAGFDMPLAPESFGTPLEAFSAAGLRGVAPETSTLPEGFSLQSTRLFSHPLSGEAKVVLTYSDGVDKLFFVVGKSGGSVTQGNVIMFHQDDAGMSQCLFDQSGVNYVLAGRTSNEALRNTARAIYTQVVRASRG